MRREETEGAPHGTETDQQGRERETEGQLGDATQALAADAR